MKAHDIIAKYQLQSHPEGGYFRRIWTSVEKDLNNRAQSSHIYYLLEPNDFSAFHRLDCEELWHHYEGASVEIILLHTNGVLERLYLGKDIDAGEQPTRIVGANTWFSARGRSDEQHAFVGCTVVPEFDFTSFELAERHELTQLFPQHESVICQFTRV